jgi:dCTP diphosphatase
MRKCVHYSDATGINDENQSILIDHNNDHFHQSIIEQCPFQLFVCEIQSLCNTIDEFSVARDWLNCYSSKNVILALLVEVGELADCFQWEDNVSSSEKDIVHRNKIAQELADVTIYLLRLTMVMDLTSSVEQSLQHFLHTINQVVL